MAVDYTDKKERFRLAREIAEEGIILLKNENGFLPLGQETVAVFGRTQVDTIKCGTGSAFCESEYTADILSGMEREGISVDATLASCYRTFAAENPISAFGVWGSGSHLQPEMPISEEAVHAAASRAEKAIIVIGRTAGENDDISPIAGDYLLSSEEERLITLVCRHFSRVCVVINSGNLVDLAFVDRPEIEALLLLSLPGMEGGNALAGVLSGRVNPSGKLTDTIAYEYRDYPASAVFGKRSGLIQKYTEDIYVGYRYFETFAPERVRYPFGFGLSYTSFETACVSFSVEDGMIRAAIDVTNTGNNYAGKEVVMLYSTSPRKKLGAPALELRTFAKTELLAPGETERVKLSFAVSEMASFDDVGVIARDAWVMEKGTFRIAFGNNVKALRPAGSYENPACICRPDWKNACRRTGRSSLSNICRRMFRRGFRSRRLERAASLRKLRCAERITQRASVSACQQQGYTALALHAPPAGDSLIVTRLLWGVHRFRNLTASWMARIAATLFWHPER